MNVFNGCKKKVKPIALSINPEGCDGEAKPAGLDSMDKNTKSGRRGLALGKLGKVHETVFRKGSKGLPGSHQYDTVKIKLAKIYDNEMDPMIHDKHIMTPWERCMTVMWTANYWITTKKYKDDKAVGGIGIDTGVCLMVGCGMDVRGDEKSNGHIIQNINNLFNPWDLVPEIKQDGAAFKKCQTDAIKKDAEVSAKLNIETSANAGTQGISVGATTGYLFFKTHCNKASGVRFDVGVGQPLSASAALGACGADAGITGTILKLGLEKEGKCGNKFNVEGALTYGFSKKFKLFSGKCKGGAFQGMSAMDGSGNSFFKDTGFCLQANLGVSKIVGGHFKIGFCLAGDRIERVFASNSFPNEAVCLNWAEKSKAGNDEPCTYSMISGSRL